MASNVVNIETIRDAWATILTTALVGAGKPVQAVYNYKKANLGGQSPVVVVTTSGAGRGRATTSSWGSDIYLETWILVLYSDLSSYQEDDAEDTLNLIEKDVADALVDNNSNANWIDAEQVAVSRVQYEDIGGVVYMHMRIEHRFTARSSE